MILNEGLYTKALRWALALHAVLITCLLFESPTRQASLAVEAAAPAAATQQPEVVKALSVDSQAVDQVVNQLKAAREQAQQAAVAKQQAAARELEAAKQARLQEQRQLAQLKKEANTLAVARKKQAEEEQKRLKALAAERVQEAKRLQALQAQKEALLKQKAQEAHKLAELQQQKEAAKAAAQALQKKQALAQKMAAESAKAAAMAKSKAQGVASAAKPVDTAAQAPLPGEVDKYKALIVNAIGQHWIVPEKANRQLSSQFSIRLAPNGMVLEVRLLRSSGDPLLDRSAQTAIYKASPLPVPTDAVTFNLFREISLTVRPEAIRG